MATEAFIFDAVRTPRGRMAGRAAWDHFGLKAPTPGSGQGALFKAQD